MRQTYIVLSLLILMWPAAYELHAQQDLEFEHDGRTREYHFYKPSSAPPNAPLVFVLHGFSSSNDRVQDSLGFDDLADRHGFAVCYPQGRRAVGVPHWNAQLTLSSVDDIGFLTELAIYLQNEHDLDPERTFSAGFSNGGFMSYTLACQAPEVFRAIASVSGLMSGETWATCDPVKAVPVLQMHGLADTFVPTDGSMSFPGGWGGAPRLDVIVDFWAKLNDLTVPETTMISSLVSATYFRNPLGGNEVWYYLIDDLGHDWPTEEETGLDGAEVVWEFFSQYEPDSAFTSVGEERAAPIVNIFPNPAGEFVTIGLDQPRRLEYRLTNMLGGLVGSGEIYASRTRLDLRGLARGMYMLHVDGAVYRVIKAE